VIPQHPLVFLGIVALLTITPGADMAMVARSVFTGGRRDAFATTLGISAGCLAWACASALGVAAVLAASQTAYDALRLVGAAYLVWLGIQSLLAARWGGYGAAAAATATPRRTSPFRQGLLTNLLNPKIAVFYSTFLPQFIAPGDSALTVSMLLACVHITLGILWLSLYAWLLGRAVEAFKGSRLRRALDALTGTVLVALGLRLAAERR
jgi:threonine/homoserine/homoserine lactone efflux protein